MKNFMLSRQQAQIIDANMRKNPNKSAILIFFQPLLNLSENWSFVTCIKNFGKIHENFSSYRAHKVKLLKKNEKNHNKSAI